MHLGEISFCDKVGFNVKSDEFKAKLLKELDDRIGFKIIQKHHERFHEGIVDRLNKNPHMVSVRSNGNPYLLYLTRHQFENQCIFIDKKIQHGYFYPRMIITKLWFHDDLFDNTLFDGEMVKRKDGSWVFLVNDMIICRGTSMSNMRLIERINSIYQILDRMFMEDDHNVCSIEVKKYFTYQDLKSNEKVVQKFINELDYTSRGVYFKPMYLKFKDVLMNFDDSLIKKVVRTKVGNFIESKAAAENPNPIEKQHVQVQVQEPVPTLPSPTTTTSFMTNCHNPEQCDKDEAVFWIKKTSQPDIYDLIDNNGMPPRMGGAQACVNSMQTSTFLRQLMGSCTVTDKMQVKCRLHPKFKKWVPYAEARS